ncbi:methyltransferase [Agaricicola taiwanensis]|uniref:Methyltransferase n=1 Tax=Agaricicola taiwanensis TaxID=591372 RepID=A0A8J2VL56_9RHOB|nr:methyltransferase [Agaricicola taiwanensis]GGE35418.1 methyltransferase [Agaricicola taiwanensis]
MTDRELTTEDRLLNGRLLVRQPARGHRAGTDAVLLAAAVQADSGQTIADFGAGVGSVGLMVAARCPDCRLTLVEIDGFLAELARQNVSANHVLADVVEANVETANLAPGSFDHVAMNPPFYPPAAKRSPDPRTARARIGEEGLVEAWIETAHRVLRPGGVLTLIHRADALAGILTAMAGFGSLVVAPVQPHANASASRVIIAGVKNAKGPLVLERPLILNTMENLFTPEARAIHQGAAFERSWPAPRRQRRLRPSRYQPR